jgi:hypothetical protein
VGSCGAGDGRNLCQIDSLSYFQLQTTSYIRTLHLHQDSLLHKHFPFFLLLRSLPTLFFTSCIAFYIIIIADWNMPTRSRSPLMSWKNTRFLDDIDVDAASTTRPSQPNLERRSSYSLERFLQEPDEPELSPASSVEARHLDTTEFARRRKRMQSPSSSTGPYHGGVPPPVSGRRPRLLLMGQRRLVSRFPRHRYHLANTAAGAGSRQ